MKYGNLELMTPKSKLSFYLNNLETRRFVINIYSKEKR